MGQTVMEKEIGDGALVGSHTPLEEEKGHSKAEDQHARRMKARAAAAAAAGAAAAKRAAALSAALLEDDEQAISASGGGKKPLFASRNYSTGGLRAEGVGAGFGGETEHASVYGRDDEKEEEEEPVNIAVVSRCRPLLVREMKRGVRAAVFCDGNEIVVSGELLPSKRPRRFGFDRVFGESAEYGDV